MGSNKLEYDSSLGGHVSLPTHVQTFRYAANVVSEMRQLIEEVRNPVSRKLVFQTLPKHMRRRAMSHHPKRLPRKYRGAHRSQMAKAGKPQQTKRPSRKFRRRPGNLLRDYLRRQRKNIWLETHIWHAKRFHMVERWGYKLPQSSCDKTYRACYRASAEHCLLQDMSFYACIELKGKLADLRIGFARLSSTCCGFSIAAKTYLTGRREGSIDLFRDGKYPEYALGRISFMWQPISNNETKDEEEILRTLWLWVHPSAYPAVVEELIKVFEVTSLNSIKVPIETDETKHSTPELPEDNKSSKPIKLKELRRLQFMTKTLAFEHIKRYGNVKTGVRINELKDTMNRFRLTGHLAQSVLLHTFKPKNLKNSIASSWLHTLFEQNPDFKSIHENQLDFWENCSNVSSSGELLSNMILALNIEDPRLNRPKKRTKAQHKQPLSDSSSDFLFNMPNNLAQSILWDTKIRDGLCKSMITPSEYSKLRAKHAVVPGDRCQFEEDMQAVPVILIQRPGSQRPQYKRLGYGCGWDVIIPAGYGMPIWLSLIMWGAKPGGLREFESIAREMGTEEYLPDTIAGRVLANTRHHELRAKYFRKPPNRRQNYQKLAIISPFRAPFSELVRDWSSSASAQGNTSTQTFHILRDRALLQQLLLHIQGKCKTFPTEIPENSLIQLHFRMKSRGNLEDYSLICLPTRGDFKRNLKQIKKSNHEPVFSEPLLPDLAERERKQLRHTHKKLLKRLRARRVREKRKLQEISTTRVYIRAANTATLVAAQLERMCKLWLPEDFATLYTVRKQCQREVFGYATTAHFSYTEATVCAVGYVTPAGLQQLLTLCRQCNVRQPMCLMRSPKSRHYRFACFKLHLDV
ncbi:PREDICTED: ribonucleases P/MRP protein subunit POP1 [Bactrocera latifrons]|uniref:Ribonucleases P/MRP protein subunit POP1 n=1 Tax=Bactrocera latifrons TaxID=174628 RepID=A0A0K8VG13_BACLA|nr:PREDICTED: ribonucleases P/MRP protein subunit POP1 [Bactrocera latifrons]